LWILGAAIIFILAPAHAQNQTIRVLGLTDSVEIIKDRWGIPHIYAKNEADLFLAQGYNAARERLFQLEIWRRQATGTAAEILGKKQLARDMGARLHMFRGNMKQELSHYHPHKSRIGRRRKAASRTCKIIVTTEISVDSVSPWCKFGCQVVEQGVDHRYSDQRQQR
jgi:penicillin amidase